MTDPHSIAPPWIIFPDFAPLHTNEDAQTRGENFTTHAGLWLQLWEPMSPEARLLHLAQWHTSTIELPAPWFLLPHLGLSDLWEQGYAKRYLNDVWMPYWNTLSSKDQARYFVHWNGNIAWREKIATFVSDADLEPIPPLVSQDARAIMTVRYAQNIAANPRQPGRFFWAKLLLWLHPRPALSYRWMPATEAYSLPPPWHILPELKPDSAIPTGIAHRYIADYWRPLWVQHVNHLWYYRGWNIPKVWQDAIARWTDPATFDAEADAKSSADFSAAFDKTLRAGHARRTGSQDPFSPEHGGPDAALRAAGFDPETPSGQELRDYISYCWPDFWRSATLKERHDYLQKWAS